MDIDLAFDNVKTMSRLSTLVDRMAQVTCDPHYHPLYPLTAQAAALYGAASTLHLVGPELEPEERIKLVREISSLVGSLQNTFAELMDRLDLEVAVS